MYSFCAMYSLRMSVWIVPRRCSAGHALLLPDSDVEREQDRRRRVDRHRGRDVAERDPAEERLHVLERVDRHPLAADLALRPRVVGVVAHQRRHVERGREPRLAVVEQVPEPLVRLDGGAEACELAHRPELAAVHRRIDAAREREDAWVAEVAVVVERHRVGCDERLVLEPGDRREELALPFGRAVVQLLAPGLRRVQRVAILRRRHAGDCTCARSDDAREAPSIRILDLDFSFMVVSVPWKPVPTAARYPTIRPASEG